MKLTLHGTIPKYIQCHRFNVIEDSPSNIPLLTAYYLLKYSKII